MKFKDKDGNVFEDIVLAFDEFCQKRSCRKCKLKPHYDDYESCSSYVESHPAKAARLMGYEVVEDKEEIQRQLKRFDIKSPRAVKEDHVADTGEMVANMDKPLSDWTPGEIKGLCEKSHCDGCLFGVRDGYCKLDIAPTSWDLTDPTRFTEEEVAFVRYFMGCYGVPVEDSYIKRPVEGQFCFHWNDKTVFLPVKLFPSILPGQSVKLSEIVGGTQ